MRLSTFALILVALGSGAVNAASFDCAGPSGRIEVAICMSPRVSELDFDLGKAYKRALVATDHAMQLKQAQRAWLKGTRDRCADETCLVDTYQQRIAEIEEITGIALAATSAPAASPTLVNAGEPAGAPQRAAASASALGAAPANSPAPGSTTFQSTSSVEVLSANHSLPALPVVAPTDETSGKLILGLVLFALLLAVWVPVAIASRRRQWSKVLSQSVGFGAGTVAILMVASAVMSLRSQEPRVLEMGMQRETPGPTATSRNALLLSIESMAGLELGQTPADLPRGFALIQRTPEERQRDAQIGAAFGIAQKKCYLNEAPQMTSAEVTAFKAKSALLCFDPKSRLVDVAIMMPNNHDVFRRLRDQIVAALESPGEPQNDSGIVWQRHSGYPDHKVSLTMVPSSLMLIESVDFDQARADANHAREREAAEIRREGDLRTLPLARATLAAPHLDPIDALERLQASFDSTCHRLMGEGTRVIISSMKNRRLVWGNDVLNEFHMIQQADSMLQGAHRTGCGG